ncbi:MAG: BTAD domain-containing putative transcriptional regulator [Acidimicrobiales bacterium]
MSRSFRYTPPEAGSDLVRRPRLLRSLAGRWQHRVTSVTGGPGFGKTTVLTQAIAENRLAPRGQDVWIGMEPGDADAGQLAEVIAKAVGPRGRDVADGLVDDTSSVAPAMVADALWQRAPTEACLVLDDVHVLPRGSTGAAWLTDLIDALPANGHVVFASRSEPPVRLSRYQSQGAVLQLAEDDLRFSDEELLSFADHRGLDSQRFEGTGGWPAMAELAASVGSGVAEAYLWEEVLEPLGAARRHVLAVVCDLGGADDELVSAALRTPVELAEVFDGVPLVTRAADGWYVPHGLWASAPRIALSAEDRTDIRRRAAEHLVERGRFDDAFALIQAAGLWDVAPEVLRSACLASERLAASQLERWISACPADVRASSAGALARGLHAALTVPSRAIEPLQQAVERCRVDGDADGELTAIAQLGRLAWWRQDLSLLVGVAPRVFELKAAGHPKARALEQFGWALAGDISGDDAVVLKHLGRIEPGVLDPAFDALASCLAALVRLYRGEAETAYGILENLAPTTDPAMRYILDTLELMTWWARGRIDVVLDRIPAVLRAARASGVTSNLYVGMSTASIAYSYLGDVAAAIRCLDEAMAAAPPPASGTPSVHAAVATALSAASVQLAEGHETQATVTLERAIDTHGLDRGFDRRWWRQTVTLSYVLVPETRKHWDTALRQSSLVTARNLAAAVVAVRKGESLSSLQSLRLPDLGVVRGALHHQHAAELAVGLAAAGRPEGRALLETLGPPGRSTVRALTSQPRFAKPAKALLLASPAPPRRSTYLAVLGPLSLHRDGPDGEEVVDPDLRRQRVQALLGFLVANRRTTRSQLMAVLWPDLDERAAGNNLAVTLNRLLRLLEPWRDSGEPSYLVRLDGPSVRLVSGEHLRVDVDDFDGHLEAAAQAEDTGAPSLALEHYLDGVALYRGDLHVDLAEAPWFVLARERYRARFVAGAVRAGQLLLGQARSEQAEEVALQALAVDPWSEEAYAVLVGAPLVRGDRSTAHRRLLKCFETLADLGVDPSEATQQLHRRILQPAEEV